MDQIFLEREAAELRSRISAAELQFARLQSEIEQLRGALGFCEYLLDSIKSNVSNPSNVSEE